LTKLKENYIKIIKIIKIKKKTPIIFQCSKTRAGLSLLMRKFHNYKWALMWGRGWVGGGPK
jgi:hypothetical protein